MRQRCSAFIKNYYIGLDTVDCRREKVETKVTCLSHVWHPDQLYANYRATYTTVTGLGPWPNTCSSSSPVPSALGLAVFAPWIHTRTHTHIHITYAGAWVHVKQPVTIAMCIVLRHFGLRMAVSTYANTFTIPTYRYACAFPNERPAPRNDAGAGFAGGDAWAGVAVALDLI